MSQSSKVNLAVRNRIITFMSTGSTATNKGLKIHVLPGSSLRSIQEATQKLTAEGVLTQSRANGQTWYSIANVG